MPSHSKRRPRPCGLTIHPAKGCPFDCSYCYIRDMGIGFEPKVAEINGKELVEEILKNPFFVNGKIGVFLAIGSLGEPFLAGKVLKKTIDFISSLKTLGNPIQVSTKCLMPEDPVLKGINVLVTVVTLNNYKQLESGAPSPIERMENAKRAAVIGAFPTLFVRPIIPGITDVEMEDILDEAKKAGFRSVVFGTLRVTNSTIKRLKSAGIDVKPILNRIKTLDNSQRYIRGADLKESAMEMAREKGLIALGSACCASALAYGVPCMDVRWIWRRCTLCPNKCWEKVPSEEEVIELLRRKGIKGIVEGSHILLSKSSYKRLSYPERYKLEILSRRIVTKAK
ncbi:MAG: radical SAM protein [Thermoproteota archaeon]|nr:MAG: radical SAM protein [Candidatus Korarchaeota archaeon]